MSQSQKILMILGMLGALALAARTAHAQSADGQRGKALYENHCVVCHTGKVHARPNRIVFNRNDIIEIVERWQVQQKLRWGTQEVLDVAEYLMRDVYKLER